MPARLGAPRIVFEPVVEPGSSGTVVLGGRLDLTMGGNGEPVATAAAGALVFAFASFQKVRGGPPRAHEEFARLVGNVNVSADGVCFEIASDAKIVYPNEAEDSGAPEESADAAERELAAALRRKLRLEYALPTFVGAELASAVAELRLPEEMPDARFAEVAVALEIDGRVVAPAQLNDILDLPLLPTHGACLVRTHFSEPARAEPVTLVFTSVDGSIELEQSIDPTEADAEGIVPKVFEPLDRSLNYSLFGIEGGAPRIAIFEDVPYHRLAQLGSDIDVEGPPPPDDPTQETGEPFARGTSSTGVLV